ncbi:MAG: hypothetical protein MJ133_07985 [Lachnospiraceae bacterium]|nr:hypothetical protein [Lachnospiraceae bacterium]
MGAIFKSLGMFFWDNKITFLIIICSLVILIIVLRKLIKANQKKKELRQAALERARDEKLNSFILNRYSPSDHKEVYVPYDVDYSDGINGLQYDLNNRSVSNPIMIQIIERTGLSERKFALNASKGIRIGTSKEDDIEIISENRVMFQCELFVIKNKLYVKNNMPASIIIIKRNKKQAVVDARGLAIKSGDTLLIGTYSYTITIVD